jgi:hypothetical protein
MVQYLYIPLFPEIPIDLSQETLGSSADLELCQVPVSVAGPTSSASVFEHFEDARVAADPEMTLGMK